MTNTQTTPPSSTSKRSRVLIPDTCVHCACAPACPCVRAYVCARAFVCVEARVSALMLTAGLHDQVLRLGALATFTPDSLHFLIKLRKRSLQVACKHARARARTCTRTHTRTHTHTHAHTRTHTHTHRNPNARRWHSWIACTQLSQRMRQGARRRPRPTSSAASTHAAADPPRPLAGWSVSQSAGCTGIGQHRIPYPDRQRELLDSVRAQSFVVRLYRHRPASGAVPTQTGVAAEGVVGQCAGSELCRSLLSIYCCFLS